MDLASRPAPWLLLLGAPLALAAAAPSDGRIVAQPLRPGATVQVSASSDMAIRVDVRLGGRKVKELEFPGHLSLTCAASVASADEGGCTAGRLVFGRAREVELDSFGGKATPRTPDYSGATYDVARADSGFSMKGARGRLSPREAEVATALADATLGLPPLGALLDGRAFRKGERIEVPVEVGRKVLGFLFSDAELESLTLGFDGERREAGAEATAFEATATLNANGGDPSLRVVIKVAGDILVAKSTGLVLAVRMAGPVTMAGAIEDDGRKLDLSGNGTWKVAYTAKPQ